MNVCKDGQMRVGGEWLVFSEGCPCTGGFWWWFGVRRAITIEADQ